MPLTPLASAASMSAVCLGEDTWPSLSMTLKPCLIASALKASIMWTKNGKVSPGTEARMERLVVGEGGRGKRHGEQARGHDTAGKAHGCLLQSS